MTTHGSAAKPPYVLEAVRQLSQNRRVARPNFRFANGDTLAHSIIKLYTDDPELETLLDRLLRQGAEPNAIDWLRDTPLMLACRLNALAAVVALVDDERTLLSLKDATGDTALTKAVTGQHLLIVATLLRAARQRDESDEFLRQRDRHGLNAEQIARSLEDKELESLLVAERVYVDMQTPEDRQLRKRHQTLKKTATSTDGQAPGSSPAGGPQPLGGAGGGWVTYRRRLRKHQSQGGVGAAADMMNSFSLRPKTSAGDDAARAPAAGGSTAAFGHSSSSSGATASQHLQRNVSQVRNVQLAKSKFLSLIGAYHNSIDAAVVVKRGVYQPPDESNPTGAAGSSKQTKRHTVKGK